MSAPIPSDPRQYSSTPLRPPALAGSGSGSGPSGSAPSHASSAKPKKRPSTSGPKPDLASPPPGSLADGAGAGAPDLTKIRAYAACSACRSKKVKCLPAPSNVAGAAGAGADGQPGPCQQCIASGGECRYPPTRDRAAYSRQYVQNLESRVQALEMVQNRLLPLLDAFESGAGAGAGAVPMRLGQGDGVGARIDWRDAGVGGGGGSGAGGHVNGNGERYASASVSPTVQKAEPVPDDGDGEGEGEGEGDDDDDDEAVEDTGQMTQDERGNYRWIGTNNTLSLLDSFSATPHHRQPELPTTDAQAADAKGGATNPYFAPVAGAGVIKALPTVDEVMYPSPELAERFIDAYFAEIHPILPVMIEHEFRKGYAAVMERRSKGIAEQSGIVSANVGYSG